MVKYFVYRKKNTSDQYWSVNKGWSKYEWATVYSEYEVDRMCDFGFDPSVLDGEWVRHEPPKPTPVIIGDGITMCSNPGYYWIKRNGDSDNDSDVEFMGKHSKFMKNHMYVYIPEPNWP